MSGVHDFKRALRDRPQPFTSDSVADFHGKDLPPREWIVPGVLVKNGVTLLSGDGGVGKSLLCMQLQVAAAIGGDWFGIALPREPMVTMGFYCEDEKDELHRRFDACCKFYGCSYQQAEAARFSARLGLENILMQFLGRNDLGQTTKLFEQLGEEIQNWGVRILFIDTAADVFLGNENARPQVKAFVKALVRLVMPVGGGVVLNAHPSRSGMADGSGQSGSTGWHGAARARLYLTAPRSPDKDADGEEEPADERLLKTMKSNYGRSGDKIRLKWQDGVFVRTDLAAGVSKSMFDKLDDDRRVLDAATYLVSRGSMLAADPNARNSLAVLARNLPSCKMIAWKSVMAAQERLIEKSKLVTVELGPKSKRRLYVRPAHLRYPGEQTGETETSIPVESGANQEGDGLL